MSRFVGMLLLVICVLSLASFSLPQRSVQAAVGFENFETQAMFTDAEDLGVSGVSFDGNGNFFIFPAVSSPHISNHALGQKLSMTPVLGLALTLNFSNVQGSTTFGWRIKADDNLIVNGYWEGNHQFTQTFVGDLNPDIPAIFYEQTATVAGKYDTLVLSSVAGELLVIDKLISNDFGSFVVPNVGMVQIDRSQAQPVYDSPGGGVVRDGAGNEIWLPNVNNNTYADSYVVTGTKFVGGQWWVQLFVGSADFVWVPLDKVTPLSSLVVE